MLDDSIANKKVVLITGAAKRVGATIAQNFHQQRKNSAIAFKADLCDTDKLEGLIAQVLEEWGQLDVLINNASSFYPVPLAKVTPKEWEELIASNLKAPFFLSQLAAPHLKQQKGCIINLVDIQARRPLKNYSVYCIAKAGLVMLTKSLAKELGPEIRVNAISTGIVLWRG